MLKTIVVRNSDRVWEWESSHSPNTNTSGNYNSYETILATFGCETGKYEEPVVGVWIRDRFVCCRPRQTSVNYFFHIVTARIHISAVIKLPQVRDWSQLYHYLIDGKDLTFIVPLVMSIYD